MKDVFLFALRAVLPILLLMLLGYLTGRRGRWDDGFFSRLNSLCFHVFLPVQLFLNVSGLESLAAVNWRLLGYLVGGIALALLAGALAAHCFIRDPRQKGVIAMAAFRSNHVILGLPLAEALGGSAAMGFAAVGTSFCVPVFNLLSVLLLTAYSDRGGRRSLAAVLRELLRNPLILGAGLGFLVLLLRHLAPAAEPETALPILYQTLRELAKVASPLMLFALGARLDLRATRALLPQLCLGVGLRLVAMPALLIGGAVCLRDALGLTAVELPTLLAVFASPCAVSSTVMVQEIGGDEQLAGQLVMWSSVLSMASLFVFALVLRALGLL